MYCVFAAYLKEVQHRLLKFRGVTFLRPMVSPRLVPVAADLHTFLRVRRFIAQFGYRSSIDGLGDIFPANLDVATIRTGVIPCEFILWQRLVHI